MANVMNCGKQRFQFEASFYIRFRESSYVIRQYSKSKLAYEALMNHFFVFVITTVKYNVGF